MSIERKSVAPGIEYAPTALAIHHARYLLARELVAGKRVLDIACGEGLGSAQMAGAWKAAHVTGVDNSASSVANARKTFAHVENVRFEADDAYHFLETCNEQFEVIVSIETIEHVDNPQRLLELIKERLAPGGRVLVTCPNDAFYYGPGPSLNEHHKSVFSFDQFRRMTEAVFGKASWYIGTKLAGFAGIPLTFEHFANRYGSMLPTQEDGGIACRMVPVGAVEATRMASDSGVFFAGIFCGEAERQAVVSPSLGVICVGSGFRQAVPGVFNNIQGADPERRIKICLVCEDRETARRVRVLIKASNLHRLAIDVLALDRLENEPQRQAVGAVCAGDKPPPQLIHFVGLKALRKFIEVNCGNFKSTAFVRSMVRSTSNQVWTLGLMDSEDINLARTEKPLVNLVVSYAGACSSAVGNTTSHERVLFGCPESHEDEAVAGRGRNWLDEREFMRILQLGQVRAGALYHSARLRGLESALTFRSRHSREVGARLGNSLQAMARRVSDRIRTVLKWRDDSDST